MKYKTNPILLSPNYYIFAIAFNLLILLLGNWGLSANIISIAVFSIILLLSIYSLSVKKYDNLFFYFLLGIGIPSDIFRYLLIILFVVILGLFSPRKKPIGNPNITLLKKIFYFLLVFLLSTSIFLLGNSSDMWCFPLYLVTFFSYPIGIFFLMKMNISEQDLNKMLKALLTIIFSHLMVVLVFPIIILEPSRFNSFWGSLFAFLKSFGFGFNPSEYSSGDYHASTLASAINVGMVSILFSFMLFFLYLFSKRNKYLLLSILSAIVYVMTDTKHTYPISIAMLFVLVWTIRNKIKIAWIKRLPYLGVIIIVIYFILNMSAIFNSFRYINKSYTEDINNPKFILYLRSFNLITENPFFFIVGRSPGTYGSRVANARAADILAKPDIKLPEFIPNFYSEDFGDAMFGLYTEDFVGKSKSGALMNPFASMVGIIMEMGLIGAGIFFFLLFSIYKYAKRFFLESNDYVWMSYALMVMFTVVYMIFAAIFDQYFEKPVSATFFWVIIGIFLLKYRNFSKP